MAVYRRYRRTNLAEMTPWTPDMDLYVHGVSVSEADRENGSPKEGDMIARNPKNHNDKWLVAADYFAENFELVGPLMRAAAGIGGLLPRRCRRRSGGAQPTTTSAGNPSTGCARSATNHTVATAGSGY